MIKQWDDALIVLALVRWRKFVIQRILLTSRKVDPILWPPYWKPYPYILQRSGLAGNGD